MADYLAPINSKLDADQVLRRAYDEPNNRLRVDAQVTATIGTINVVIDAASGDNIKISDGVDTLDINPDGSINVKTTINHTTSSTRLGDGTNLITSTAAGLKQGLDVNVINQTNGSTIITDGTDNLNVNPDGSINVIITGGSTTSINYTSIYNFNEINSVTSNSLTLLQTYTVPVGKKGYLQRVDFSGENIAKYIIKLNGSTLDIKRTYFGNQLNGEFNFIDSNDLGMNLNAGDVIETYVIHTRPSLISFEARIQVLLYVPPGSSVNTLNIYNEQSAITSGILTTLASYTTPISTNKKLQKIICSGDNVSKYLVYVNGSVIDLNRTYFGGSLNVDFDFTSANDLGYGLSTGDLIEVKVIHNRLTVSDYNARIQILEV
jgi:hypothetical protein